MRKFIIIFIIIVLTLGGVYLKAEKEKNKNEKEVKKKLNKCEKMQKTNDATNKLIISVGKGIGEIKKEYGGFPPQAEADMKDFTEWYTKANKLAEITRAKIKKGECNKKILKDLGWVWQYYVKAATMAVNAKANTELALKNRKRKNKK